MTPTEIVQAMNYGASIVKLFPCSSLGPSYLKELRGPLNELNILAVGGITKENAPSYLQAGASSVGIGGNLVALNEIQQGNYSAITNLRRAAHGGRTCSEPSNILGYRERK
jgi:2-dehydro-3-deoxyphosphogluconate aldolase/(4S)-4-hydroxy-2-oxoglutarate aldolase